MLETIRLYLNSVFRPAVVDTSDRDQEERDRHTLILGASDNRRASDASLLGPDEAAEQVLIKAQEAAEQQHYGDKVVVKLDESQRHVDRIELDASLRRMLTGKYSGLAINDDDQHIDYYCFTKIRPWSVG